MHVCLKGVEKSIALLKKVYLPDLSVFLGPGDMGGSPGPFTLTLFRNYLTIYEIPLSIHLSAGNF